VPGVEVDDFSCEIQGLLFCHLLILVPDFSPI
jgi:hypothetical protein